MPKKVHELVNKLLKQKDFYPDKSEKDRESSAWAIAYSQLKNHAFSVSDFLKYSDILDSLGLFKECDDLSSNHFIKTSEQWYYKKDLQHPFGDYDTIESVFIKLKRLREEIEYERQNFIENSFKYQSKEELRAAEEQYYELARQLKRQEHLLEKQLNDLGAHII